MQTQVAIANLPSANDPAIYTTATRTEPNTNIVLSSTHQPNADAFRAKLSGIDPTTLLATVAVAQQNGQMTHGMLASLMSSAQNGVDDEDDDDDEDDSELDDTEMQVSETIPVVLAPGQGPAGNMQKVVTSRHVENNLPTTNVYTTVSSTMPENGKPADMDTTSHK